MSEIVKGYFNKNGEFIVILHGNKAFCFIDGEQIEYKVKTYRRSNGVLTLIK